MRPASGFPARSRSPSRFDVNRHTVRRALADLAQRGLVRAERGSGTFVAPGRLAYPIGAAHALFRDRRHRRPRSRRAADRRYAWSRRRARSPQRLGLALGEAVVRLEILRSADRVPICIATTWLPARRMADAARVFRVQARAHRDVRPLRRSATTVAPSTHISAAMADAVDAQRLRIAPGRPVLRHREHRRRAVGRAVVDQALAVRRGPCRVGGGELKRCR